MKIKIICVGKIKKDYLKDGILDYLTRINNYCKCEIIEVKDVDDSFKNAKEIEGESILKQIKSKEYVIAFTLNKTQLTSEEFASKLENIFMKNSDVDFIIGGSTGISDTVLKRCNEFITLSKLTFPHQLCRLIAVEQIYRCFKIINHEKYHK